MVVSGQDRIDYGGSGINCIPKPHSGLDKRAGVDLRSPIRYHAMARKVM